MKFNDDLLYVKRINEVGAPYVIGEYKGKYFKSDDIVVTGRDGQNIRFHFLDRLNCSVIEIFSLAKPVNDRYNDDFQKTYGKVIISSRNLIADFGVQFHTQIQSSPTDRKSV